MKDNGNTEDRTLGTHAVQCQMNNHPIKVRGNLPPYSIYFSQTNVSTYSQLLGDSHKTSRTEYGLRLAKMIVLTVKKVDGTRILSQDSLVQFIHPGDKIFDWYATDGEEVTDHILKQAAHAALKSIEAMSDEKISIQSKDTKDFYEATIDDEEAILDNDAEYEPRAEEHAKEDCDEDDNGKQGPKEDMIIEEYLEEGSNAKEGLERRIAL
jgi:hypothetical protein